MTHEAIRILQALTKSEVGGTELMVLRLVRGVDRTRFACEVCSLTAAVRWQVAFRPKVFRFMTCTGLEAFSVWRGA